MKKQLISMGCLLIFFSAACFSQKDTSSSYKWEVGVKMNSMKNNIWDPFEVDGNNIKNLGWFNGVTEIPHSRNTQFSFGMILKKKKKKSSFNLRVDYGYKKSHGIVGPFPNYPDTLIYLAQEEYSRKSRDITIAPQIEFNFRAEKIELSYGFELPWTDYGNAQYFQNALIFNKNTGDIIDGGYQNGELAYGHSIGVGIFAGFYYAISSKISLGGLFFSSIEYYENNGTSYEIDESINPASKVRIEDKMNIKATVYQPINISLLLTFKFDKKKY